jgi:DNA-directed RNA polymerase subunit K/omega
MAETDNTEVQETTEPLPPAAPITSRFLFVDVAAQRAKQLRRGALSKIDRAPTGPQKLERLAMEEVKRGTIHYTVPPLPGRSEVK